MFDYILFALPLVPLLYACYEDLKDGQFCSEHLIESVLLAAFWKLLGYPNTIILSISFACFTTAVGLMIMHWRGWNLGDGLYFGVLGFLLPAVNIDFFVLTAMVALFIGALADKLLIQKIIKKHFQNIYIKQHRDKVIVSFGLWVVALVYLVFWVMYVAGLA